MSKQVNGAYITLLTSPSYLAGILVLHASLLTSKTRYPFVAMVTPSLGNDVCDVLKRRGIIVREVQSLRPEEGKHRLHEHDRRFADTWTKLRAFELVEYDRVVMLDCDMIIRRNMDELFELKLPGSDWIACAHACLCNPRRFTHYPSDWIAEHCAYTPLTHPSCLKISPNPPRRYRKLNSGLVVLNPSHGLYSAIEHFVRTSPLIPTFRFPDQDVLSAFFADHWRPLPYIYNALKTVRTTHPKMWRDGEVKCLHYIIEKPWEKRYGPDIADEKEKLDCAELHRWWWIAYRELENEMKVSERKGWELADRYVRHS